MTRSRMALAGFSAVILIAGGAAFVGTPADDRDASGATTETVVLLHYHDASDLTMNWRITRLDPSASDPSQFRIHGESVGGDGAVTATFAPVTFENAWTTRIADGVEKFENAAGESLLAIAHGEHRNDDNAEFLVVNLDRGEVIADGRVEHVSDEVELTWAEMLAVVMR